jgi:hypothetical protein
MDDNNIWVAGGMGSNQLIYSLDGITWTPSQTGNAIFTPTGSCNTIVWNGLLWLAAGTTLAFSSDGMYWQQGKNPLQSETVWESLAWNGTLWVGAAKGLYYSYDGFYWSSSTNSSSQYTRVNWNGSLWIAGGENQSLMFSLNGKSWNPSPDTHHLSQCYSLQSRNKSLQPPTVSIKSIIVNPDIIDCTLFENVRLDISGINTIILTNVPVNRVCKLMLFIYTDVKSPNPTIVSLKYNATIIYGNTLISSSPTLIDLTSCDNGQTWIVNIKK